MREVEQIFRVEYQDYYQSLGVDRTATEDDIRKAYRRLAKKYHPDVSTEPNAEQRFKEIGEAYEVLRDPQKREAYNQLGSNWQAGQNFEPPPGWTQQFHFSRSPFGSQDGFSDLFQSLFGGGLDPFEFNGGQEMRRQQRASLGVSLEQIYSAAPVMLTIADQSGTANPKQLKVKLPHGTKDGSTLRLRGQGPQGGDLLVTINILPDDRFTLKGNDVHSEVGISPWEAVLGAEIAVATLGGTVKLKVPSGTTHGKRVRLKRRGLWDGDHYVSFRIEVPSQVSDRERDLYEQLATSSGFAPNR